MAQEFTIKSSNIEDKINQLLPSQGGFQAGVDFSASTMVVPIVDLTETAEGSTKRQDLQTALSLNGATDFTIQNSTTDIVNTTGYWKIVCTVFLEQSTVNLFGRIQVTDGTTTKSLFGISVGNTGSVSGNVTNNFNEVVFLRAGETLQGSSNDSNSILFGSVRQIADINGNLIDP